MKTLNQVVKSLNDIADNHLQINHFFFGEEWDFASSGTVNTSAMIVVLQPSVLSGSTFTYDFKIYIGDLVKKDLGNKTEVLSDTMQIALDVIWQLQHPDYDGVIDTDITLNDFEDSFDCELYGYWFDLKIKYSNPFDRCAIPINPIVTSNPLNAVKIYDIEGTLLATVAPGGSYIIPGGSFDSSFG